jgi:hypothetical protein
MLNKSALIIDIISCLRSIRALANVAVVAIMLSASQETHVAVRNAMRIGINPILCSGRPNQRSRIGSSSRDFSIGTKAITKGVIRAGLIAVGIAIPGGIVGYLLLEMLYQVLGPSDLH